MQLKGLDLIYIWGLVCLGKGQDKKSEHSVVRQHLLAFALNWRLTSSGDLLPPTARATFSHRSGVSLSYKANALSNCLFCIAVHDELLELRTGQVVCKSK
ncbi:hypothetical protein G4B88_002030 [Cannabis sativa]|uniref:Uncharacterized protein n=1 Tax=Cannabis sativa TaxID=3483 RepID=A0A7J6HD76_CANSA|nr:hypothetical protein G4B88_002030 [Cannabis sativa]